MSRSYKKSPVMADRNPYCKKQANKRVRKYLKDIANGKAYRKLYCSWNISDYRFRETLQERLDWSQRPLWFNGKNLNADYNEKKEIKKWKKFHYWK